MHVKTPDNTGFLIYEGSFRTMRRSLVDELLETELIKPASWQSSKVPDSDAFNTWELRNVTAWYDMPDDLVSIQREIPADMPWAEDHFNERVAGQPVNPGRCEAYWPYHKNEGDRYKKSKKYDHNYMERIWPRYAGLEDDPLSEKQPGRTWPNRGIRFEYGDLGDVAQLLIKDPTTRQAYLPIWFPEDTGSRDGQRVPCTLGYHFMIRDDRMHLVYNMRSCEIFRHFTNDVYMAVRLAMWMREQIALCTREKLIKLGSLTMNISSLHGFVGDEEAILSMDREMI